MPKQDKLSESRLIATSGCVVGVTFMPRSGARPDANAVRTRADSGKCRATSISVEGVDFRDAYERAIHIFADLRGIDAADPLRGRLIETRDAFMNKYGLTTRTVCYEQVVRA
jgi:hypothetical protein